MGTIEIYKSKGEKAADITVDGMIIGLMYPTHIELFDYAEDSGLDEEDIYMRLEDGDFEVHRR